MIASCALASMGGPDSASAQVCPTTVGTGTDLESIPATERFAFIDRQLWHTQRYGQIFDRAWGFGFAGTVVVLAAVGYTQPIAYIDDGQQKSLYVSAIKTAIGALAHLVRPTRVYRPTWNSDDPCGSLADAEEKLAKTARLQQKRSGWRAHVEGLALNLSGTLVLGFGYDLWKEAALGFAIGYAVGRIRLYTYPRHGIRAWSAYRQGNIRKKDAGHRSWNLLPMATSHGYGITLMGEF